MLLALRSCFRSENFICSRHGSDGLAAASGASKPTTSTMSEEKQSLIVTLEAFAFSPDIEEKLHIYIYI